MRRKLYARLLVLAVMLGALAGLPAGRSATGAAAQETCIQCISACQDIYEECVSYGEDPYVCREGRTQCVGECPCG